MDRSPIHGILLIFLLLPVVCSCARPVLRSDLLARGAMNPLMTDFLQYPDAGRNQLFVLGGIIVSTRYTDEGSLIEAIQVTVNSLGYLQPPSILARRFLAVYPIERGVLDPRIYSRDSGVTVAGFFLDNRVGLIDDTSYTYPTFMIEDIYLWSQGAYYVYPYPPVSFSIGGFAYGHNWGIAPSFYWGW